MKPIKFLIIILIFLSINYVFKKEEEKNVAEVMQIQINFVDFGRIIFGPEISGAHYSNRIIKQSNLNANGVY